MSKFVVHSAPVSPFGRAVLATLEEKEATYRFSPVEDFKAEPHTSRHPFGRVPVLEHDGFVLYETQAIIRYLDRILPEPALTPKDAQSAARMDQVMSINDWYLFPGLANVIVWQRIVGPRLMGLIPDESAIAAVVPKGLVVFGELSRLLGDRPYFAGEAVSLADLLLASQIDFFGNCPGCL
jgi:glutathione S-transferase